MSNNDVHDAVNSDATTLPSQPKPVTPPPPALPPSMMITPSKSVASRMETDVVATQATAHNELTKTDHPGHEDLSMNDKSIDNETGSKTANPTVATDEKEESVGKVTRESLLDILRDTPFIYQPEGIKDKLAHSLNPDKRQVDHQREIDMRLRRAIVLAEVELVELGDGENGVDPTIIELNQKGGAGKSPNATTTAVTLAANNDQMIIVVDGNQVLGSSLQYLDIHNTLGVRDSMEKFKENTAYSFVRKYLGHHPKYKNIYGVASDSTEKRRNNPIDLSKYYTYAKGLKSACQTLIFDNGNEVINAQTIVGLELADVLRFVTTPWVNDANRLCKDTMAEIKTLYPEKVDRAVITISACRADYPTDWDLDHWAAYFNHPKEQICLIPYDTIFEPRVTVTNGKSNETAWVVDLDQFNQTTYLANLERDILTLKQAHKGIEAAKGKKENEEDVIERMKKFLQINPDSKASSSQGVPDDADEARLIEMLLSRADGNPREAAARILRQVQSKERLTAQQ